MVLEVGGGAQLAAELACHMLAHLTALTDAARVRLRIVDIQGAFDYRRWWFLVRHLHQQHSAFTAEAETRMLAGVRVSKCDSPEHVLDALKKYESEIGDDRDVHHVVFVAGLSHFFWANRNFQKGGEAVDVRVPSEPRPSKNPKYADMMAAIIQQLKGLSNRAATVIATRLALFPKRSAAENHFGHAWLSAVNMRIFVDEPAMTMASLGKALGSRRGVVFDVDNEKTTRTPFEIYPTGCVFQTR